MLSGIVLESLRGIRQSIHETCLNNSNLFEEFSNFVSCDILSKALDKDCVVVRVVLFFTYKRQVLINTSDLTL